MLHFYTSNEVDCHFAWQKVTSELTSTLLLRSDNQLANMLTKAFSKSQMTTIFNKLSVINICAQPWEKIVNILFALYYFCWALEVHRHHPMLESATWIPFLLSRWAKSSNRLHSYTSPNLSSTLWPTPFSIDVLGSWGYFIFYRWIGAFVYIIHIWWAPM